MYDKTPHDPCMLHEKGKLDMQIQTPSKGCGQRITEVWTVFGNGNEESNFN